MAQHKPLVLSNGTVRELPDGDSLSGPSVVGLGNVDNTSDAEKPVSTATQEALDTKQDTLVSGTNINTINGESLLGAGDLQIGGLTLAQTQAIALCF